MNYSGHASPARPLSRVWVNENLIRSLVIVLALSVASPAWARSNACTSSKTCRDELILSTGGSIPYYRSLPLIRNDSVRRVVLVVHGNQRDAARYYDRAVAAAAADNGFRNLVLLAPNFRTLEDQPAADEHYWSSHGWKIGNKSLDRTRISSFAVMNELLARVCSIEPGIFPNLQTVVIVGHSAGGQFVNRYIAGGAECLNQAVEVRYVVMNPSSYLYVDSRRRSGSTGKFDTITYGCTPYDEYKYGLRSLNAYMKRVGAERIRSRLFKRRSFYLAGLDDTATGGSLDSRCEANLQGQNRLARFANYRDYASLFEDWTAAEFIVVPGIGHDGGRMLGSEIARRIMFH